MTKRPIRNHLRQTASRFRRDQRGASAVEFALLASVLSIILLNIVDIAYFMFNKMEITGAVRAGAQYALVNTASATQALIQGVVEDATSLSPVTVTVDTNLCGCSDGTTFACGASTCGGGTTGRVSEYTSIDASYTHDWIFYGGTTQITASSQIRTH